MTERINHAKAADELMRKLASAPATDDEHDVEWGFREAQVHATLALVEQEHIANHIAYVQLLESQYAEAAKHSDEFDQETRAASIARHGIALERIREGLGLS